MATERQRRHAPTPSHATLHKPRGFFHDRVQRAGPAQIGLAVFDCHNDYSRWMLADFFGNLLLPPHRLPHNRPALDDAIRQPGRQVFCHALYKERYYILDKLVACHDEHGTAAAAVLRDLAAAAEQLPPAE